MQKRILAALLTAAMAINLISFISYAEEPHEMPDDEIFTYEEAYGEPADVPMLFSLGEEEPSYYFEIYNQLLPQAQKLYTALKENYTFFSSPDAEIVVTFDKDELDASDSAYRKFVFQSAVAAFDYDCPEAFWLNKNAISATSWIVTAGSTKYVSRIVLTKNKSFDNMLSPVYYGNIDRVNDDMDEMSRSMTEMFVRAKQIRDLDHTDLYNAVCVINDHLIDENYYNRYVSNDQESALADQSPIRKAHHAASALTKQTWLTSATDLGDPASPVCEGYARAFKLVCDELDIPCIVVSGANHMWNYVYDAEKTAWYAVDCTWDDPVRDNEYLVKATPDQYRERYILVGSETEIAGSSFMKKHPPNGAAWKGGTPFAVPVLSEEIRTREEKNTDATLPVPEYRISFDVNGAGGSISDQVRAQGEKFGLLPLACRTGYSFDGWYTAADDTGIKVTVDTDCASDTVLYAHWRANSYTITFDANGGECQTAKKTVTYGSAYGTLPVPEKKGYTFTGWYTEAVEGTRVTEEDTLKEAGAGTLYAHWQVNHYKVAFDACGGACEPKETEVIYHEPYGELPVPEKKGYTFIGWYTESSEGTEVKAEDIFDALEDQILYARWQPNHYKVVFDACEGTCEAAETEVVYDEPYGELPVPVREGYDFLGWFSDRLQGTEIKAETVVGVSEDHILYARWKEKSAPEEEESGKPDDEQSGNEQPGNEQPGNDAPVPEDPVDYGDVLPVDIPEDPGKTVEERIPAKLWIAGVQDVEYTGSAITQTIRVYDGKTLLTEKKDYLVSYSDNVRAGQAFVTVTCRGNYTGTKRETFAILPKSLERVTVDRLYSVNSPKAGKSVKILQSVRDGGKLMKPDGQDYRVTYCDADGREISLTDIPAGSYHMMLEGCGNYTGFLDCSFLVSGADTPAMGSAKVMLSSRTVGYGESIPTVKSVTIGGMSYTADSTPKLEEAFRIEYPQDALSAGYHEILIHSVSDKLAGTVGAGYTVKKKKLTAGQILVTGAYSYAGEPVIPQFSTALQAGTDYTEAYNNCNKAGKAVAILKGIGGYTGTVKLSYTIEKGDIALADIAVSGAAKYDPAGAKPVLTVKMGSNLLKEGKDYTVSYQDNKAVSAAGEETAYAILKGKGSFTGSKVVSFPIEPLPVTEKMITAADKAYSAKTSVYRQPVTIKNGKTKLREGTDYTVSYSSDAQVTAADIEKGYHEITVTVTGKENSGYTGSASGVFTVYKPDRKVSKLRLSVKEKSYTGKAVLLQPEDITVRDAAGNVIPSGDVTVLSYKNNVRAGAKASAVIKVKGYGGTKTVKFRIAKKRIVD